MEDEKSSARYAILGFKPQKENIYNQLLPYTDKIDEEAVKELKLIRTNLLKCLLAREVIPGFFLWTERLERYIKLYGLMFSKEDHIRFIKMYLEVLNLENQEPSHLSKWASVLISLLKKKYLLSRDDIQIEWKPFYNHYRRFRETVKSDVRMKKYPPMLEHELITLGKLCRVYFPASATQEILDEFTPHLCPLNESETMYYMSLLDALLPICVRPEEAPISYGLWFTDFMKLWESCTNDNQWEGFMLSLMSRLSANSIGYVDFGPYIPVMYSRFIRSFQLPVYYKMRVSSKSHALGVSPMALWIVSSLNHKTETPFEYLEKFMNMIKSFLYTANVGSWTTKLKDFLNKLSCHFVNRIYSERYKPKTWENEVPEDYKMNDTDIDRFVLILKPCLELALFSRRSSNDVNPSFHHLASLRPNLILPMLVDKLYASLDSLTEPHRLTSVMGVVPSVARQIAEGAKKNYPEGPTHVIPLLMAVLPGIDPNDSKKCFMTFHFITQFISIVPIINSSEAGKYYNDLTEEEHIICEATAGFEDFVMQFIDRICVWVESCSLDFVRPEQQTSDLNARGWVEVISEYGLTSVMSVILRQCSPDIFTAALKKVFNFITRNVFEVDVAGRLTAFLCGSFSKVNPKESLKLFVPYLCSKIGSLLDENPNIDIEEHLDGEILYNMLILLEVLDGRNEIIIYLDQLMKILNRTLHVTCLQATEISVNMLTIIISTLVSIQPLERRSSGKSYSHHVKDFLPIRDWSYSLLAKDLKIEWYTPGESELQVVKHIIYNYLIPELDKLDKYNKGEQILSRTQLRNLLKIINAMLAAHSFLPMWEDTPFKLNDTVTDITTVQCVETNSYSITMPDGSNIRKVIADTLHDTQKKLLELDEGDTKSLNVIANIYSNLLLNKTIVFDWQHQWNIFVIVKKISRNRLLDRKRHPRHLLIDRAAIQQSIRVESSLYSFSSTHKQIMLDLFELGLSRYRDVRIYSQVKLMKICNHFTNSYTLFTDKITNILQMDTEKNHDKFKGCLYILSSRLMIMPDWKHRSEIWPLLVTSMPSERVSIINLITNISEIVSTNLATPSIDFDVPDEVVEKVCKLYGCQDVSVEEKEVRLTKIKNICDEKRSYYNKCLDLLLNACQDRNLHWRYHLLALGFLRDIVHFDVKYNESVVKYFLEALISDSVLVRKIAIKAVVFILIQNKLKYTKIEIDPKTISKDNNSPSIAIGDREENKWLLYDSNKLPKNSEDWNELIYLHDTSIGYNTWPKNLEMYSSPKDQPRVSDNVDNMSPEQKEIYNFFKNEENVRKVIYYFSLEDKKGKDHFNNMKALIFKYLSKLLEDKMLDILLPHLEVLAVEKQESSQICAAEMMCGLIRGSKHWTYESTEKLWYNIIPIIQAANQNIMLETVRDWSMCLHLSLRSRDPRRYHWLLEFLIDDPLSDPTSIIAGVKLLFLTNSLNLQPWRNSELNNRLLKYLKNHMAHPFQLIRIKISCALKVIFNRDYEPPGGIQERNPKLTKFFDELMPTLDWLYQDTMKKIDNIIHEDLAADENKKREDALKLFKIVGKLIMNSLICRINLFTPLDFYRILPLTCVLQSNDVDDEIQPMCINLLALLAQSLVTQEIISPILTILETVLMSPLWSARSTLAEFLSTFVFHNMAILSSKREWIDKVQTFALILLEDPQLEVRDNGCTFLSGLLHCNFLPSPSKLLADFKLKARTKLKKSKKINSEVSCSNKSNLITRHTGVLGLCAFINSKPYDVPEFLPDIFGCLGPHLSDPQPIPGTIRKTLCDFKRTHQDNWELHKMQFTEEQLLVFQDLTLPPSYYV